MPSQGNRGRGRSDRELARVAASQTGVVGLGQLNDLGIASRAAQHRAKGGRLHRIHRGVYAVGHDAIGRNGALLAAVLVCGEGAVVSHGTSAALWGIRDGAPVLIDVIVSCEQGRKVDGIRARRCRFPTDEETTLHEGIPCTTPARTLVDLAGMLGISSLRRAVERAAVLSLLDIDALDAAILQGRGRRGVRALRAILADWRPVAHDWPRLRSDFEARLLSLIVGNGLPSPECNQAVRANGRRIEVDFLWEPQRLIVEADGRASHDNRVAFSRDRRRDQDLLLSEYRVIRLSWDQVVKTPGATVAMLRRLLTAPPPHRAVP